MLDEDKVVFDVSERDNITTSLVELFDFTNKQCGMARSCNNGKTSYKRYFYASHGVDISTYVIYAIDLTPVITDSLYIVEYTLQFIERFKNDVVQRLNKMM
jgi:hypothetical protein